MRAGFEAGAGEVFEAVGSATVGDLASLPGAAVSRDLASAELVALRGADAPAPAELRAAGADGAAGVLVVDVGVFAPVLGCVPTLGLVAPGLSAGLGALVPEAVDGAALGRATGLSTGPDCVLAFAGAAGAVAGAGVLRGPVGVADGVETAPPSGAAGVELSGVIGRCAEASGAAGAFWAPSSAGRSSPAMVTVGGGGMSPTARGGGQPVSISIIATAQTVARPVSNRLMTLPSIRTSRMVKTHPASGRAGNLARSAVDAVSR